MSNYTIEDTSPLFRFSPYSDGSVTGGWASFYSVSGFNNQPGESSQGDSSHLTKFDGAAVNLTFVGSSIILFGTANCSYDVTIDGATPATISVPPSPSVLYSNPSLSNATHSISLTAHTSSGNGSQVLGIDKAIISLPFDVNATSPTVVDNSNTSWISYQPSTAWSVAPPNGQIPNKDNPKPYHTSSDAQAFASVNWTGGEGVAVSGIANFGHAQYTVTLDGVTAVFNSSSYWIVPDALLFLQPFSDSSNASTPHSLTISNPAAVKLSLNYFTLYGNVSLLSAASQTPSSKASASPTNAGIIAGPIVAILVVLGVAAFFVVRRRRQLKAAAGDEVVTPYNTSDHGRAVSQGPDMQHEYGLTPLVTYRQGKDRDRKYADVASPDSAPMSPSTYVSSELSPTIASSSTFGPFSPPTDRRHRGPRGGTSASETYTDSRSHDIGRSPPRQTAQSSTATIDVDRIMDMIAQRIDMPPGARRPAVDSDEEELPRYVDRS